MSERWARMLLTTYRWAGVAAMPFIGAYVLSRVGKGKEDRSRRHERYGKSSQQRPDGPLVWVHAASVGETVAVLSLIDYILQSGIHVLLTTGTVTSARVAHERLGDRVIHQFVPLDLKPAVSRFLAFWTPDLAIMAESEIWPVTILELGARRIPQVLVNARMSDKSFARWQKAPYLAEALFENFAHVVAQSEADGERFRALGARPVTVSGNLKGDTEPPPVDERLFDHYSREIGSRKTWAAISTHEGEEKIAAQVHRALKSRHPDLLTIIVPRHPHRAEALLEEMTKLGLKVVTRSSGASINALTDILLGDTIGEMGLYLRLTEIAFVGRSLSGEGGQNPMEPAMLNTAVLSGVNVQNFREAYRLLIDHGGARLVRDAKMLAGAVNFLLENHAERETMMQAGLTAVEQMSGSLSRTLIALEPFLHPLIVKSRLQGGGER
ncbi:3-deoxy-D-manno-octulosonic acid transferase [Nitratireductor aestuarii]|uniref:3-deoxy-D-manno-octulosonic acid transferase n=1 Tax=Nitratireductor aestuarii TaxID=1735103 RepID=A0A916RWX3_9HYPH|nr:lipid IV(A) 3-deoxy-D-manno-octulosonic acid transferase [Nitratireductor aestuarii]GGA71513.1 3-deoxy-D-manno-octulosonic acid transferase [Nitratireductor aestuarii]